MKWFRAPALSANQQMLALLAFGICYRFACTLGPGLWCDEGASLYSSSSLRTSLIDRNGSTYFILLYFWRALGGLSEVWLRSLSAIIDCGSLLIFARICRTVLEKHSAQCFAVLLYIVIPPVVFMAFTLRMYVLWSFFHMIMLLILLESRNLTRRQFIFSAIAFNLLIALSMETQKYAAIYCIGYVLAAIALKYSIERIFWLFSIWAVLPVFLLFRLETPSRSAWTYLLERSSQILPESGPIFPLGAFLIHPTYNYFLGHSPSHGFWGGVALLLWIGGAILLHRKGHRAYAWMLISFLAPLCLMTFFPLRSYPRLLQPLAPILCIAVAAAVFETKFRKWALAAISPFVLYLAWIGLSYQWSPTQDFRGAVKLLKSSRQSDTLVLSIPAYTNTAGAYYYGPETLMTGFPNARRRLSVDSLEEYLLAFKYVEVIHLPSDFSKYFDELKPVFSKWYENTLSLRAGSIEVYRYERKAFAPAISKTQFYRKWPDATRYNWK